MENAGPAPAGDWGEGFAHEFNHTPIHMLYAHFDSQIMAEVPGNVKVILTDSDFQKELIVAGDKLVIVGFFATW